MRPSVPLVFASAVMLFAASSARAIPGDVNNDGVVDVTDVKMALRASAGLLSGADPSFVLANADVNSDGKITAQDAVKIRRDLLGTGGAAAIHAIATQDTITLSGNMVKDYKLAAGFQLSGKASWTAGTEKPYSISFEVGNTGSGSSIDATNSYTTYLPAGTYNTWFGTNFDASDPDLYDFNYSIHQAGTPSSIAISKDTVQDFVRPDYTAPPTGTVSGTLSAPNTTITSIDIDVMSANMYGSSSPLDVSAGTYSTKTLAGTAYVSVSADYESANAYTRVDASLANPLTVAANGTTVKNVTLLPVVEETGHVANATALTATDVGFYTATTGNQYSCTAGLDSSMNYLVAIPAGSYQVEVDFASGYTMPMTTWTYYTAASVPAGGGTKDITLPALPATYTFSGTITTPAGAVASGAYVSIDPVSEPATGYSCSVWTSTGADGKFSVNLPAGQYNVSIYPAQ